MLVYASFNASSDQFLYRVSISYMPFLHFCVPLAGWYVPIQSGYGPSHSSAGKSFDSVSTQAILALQQAGRPWWLLLISS